MLNLPWKLTRAYSGSTASLRQKRRQDNTATLHAFMLHYWQKMNRQENLFVAGVV
jgi:hypothetical protein